MRNWWRRVKWQDARRWEQAASWRAISDDWQLKDCFNLFLCAVQGPLRWHVWSMLRPQWVTVYRVTVLFSTKRYNTLQSWVEANVPLNTAHSRALLCWGEQRWQLSWWPFAFRGVLCLSFMPGHKLLNCIHGLMGKFFYMIFVWLEKELSDEFITFNVSTYNNPCHTSAMLNQECLPGELEQRLSRWAWTPWKELRSIHHTVISEWAGSAAYWCWGHINKLCQVGVSVHLKEKMVCLLPEIAKAVKELLAPQPGRGSDASLSAFPDGPPGSSLFYLEEEEGDARPTRVSLAPAGHPELSHVPLRARPSTRGGVVARARHVVSVWPIWGVATSSRAESSEVQVVLWRVTSVRAREWAPGNGHGTTLLSWTLFL